MPQLLKLFLTTIFLLQYLNTIAQNPDSIKFKMNQSAIKGGFGILLTTIDNAFVTTTCTDFVGLYEINAGSTQLDTVINSKLMKSESFKSSLMKLAQMMVTKGVKLRKAGKYRESFYSYRLALYLISSELEPTGGRIISSNLWVLKEEIKHQSESGDIILINSLLKTDGLKLISDYGTRIEQAIREKKTGFEELYALYRRLLDFSGQQDKAEQVVLEMSKVFSGEDIGQNQVFVTALIEQLAQTQPYSFLLPDEKDKFTILWNLYLERGKTISSDNVEFYKTELIWLWKQFDLIRLGFVNSGGPSGHKLSYELSEYMQVPGRQIVFYNMLQKDPLSALEVTEYVKARAYNDWMARSHLNRMIKVQKFTSYENLLKITQTAGLNEIYDAADSMNAPILSYMNYEQYVFSWLIMPGGAVYYNISEIPDSLFQKLFKLFPYQFQSEVNIGETSMGDRGTRLVSNTKESYSNKLLKQFWKKLLSDSMSAKILGYKGDKLIIIPDGILNYFPFAALMNDNNNYLAESKQIIYWPSVTSWMILKDASDVSKFDPPKKPVQIIGDVTFNGKYSTIINNKVENIKLSPLPGTAIEAAKIGTLFNSVPISKDAAVKGLFTGRVKHSILHLATHGYLNSENSMQSFIALSDGPLYSADLYDETFLLKCRLVVLSACQTGLGDFGKDSPLSLANSFLIGGSNSVISSLWSVNDEATSEFMIAFYIEIKKGKDSAEALQVAQNVIRMQSKWENPYYWAGFKLTGVEGNPLK